MLKIKLMKNLLLITILTLISFNCKAQNTIDSNELTVNGIIVIGKNKSILATNFGQPINIEKSFSEMDNEDMYIYKYDGIVFYVLKDLIDDYEITNNKHSFTKNSIKIGDNIDSLKIVFPLSYEKKGIDFLSLDLTDYDKYISVYFNVTTKIITKIRIGTY